MADAAGPTPPGEQAALAAAAAGPGPPGQATEPAAAPAEAADPPLPTFPVSRISFQGRKNVPILSQNENGPCPLLALANCLFLRGHIALGEGATECSQDRLLTLVASHLLDRSERLATAADAANVAANVEAALTRIPKLATGIDVNIRFSHPRAVEFTDEVALFDLAGVGLVHGWLMTPDDPEAGVLGLDAAYNATAALAVEAAAAASTAAAGNGCVSAPPPPQRSLLDEDWPPPATTTAAQPSAPPAPGLEPVPSADLADALETRLSLGDRRRTASSNGGGGGGGGAVSTLVATALAKAVAAAEANGGGPTTTTTTTSTTATTAARAAKAAAAASWLARSAGQLTPAGLVALHDPAAGGLAPGELAALFRGSHFAVAYARPRPPDPLPPGDVGGGVFTLVTDVGYRGRGVAWERLDSVDGDTTLVGADFRPPGFGGGDAGADGGAALDGPAAGGPPSEDADLALAMRLQAEEDAAARAARERAAVAAAAAQQQQQQQQAQQQQQQAQYARPLRRPGSGGGLLGFGSGRRPSGGGGSGGRDEKCTVM